MLKFEKVNRNPKGRKTGDCSTRALAGAIGISYEEALRLQYEVAVETCYGITDKQVMERVLRKFGFEKMKQPRKADGRKYKVKELDEILTQRDMKKGVFVTIAGHHTCIRDGAIQDIWDCGEYTVGNYYIFTNRV